MEREEEKQEILSALQSNRHVQDMKKYTHHGKVSTFEHCEKVANLSYEIDKSLSLNADLNVLLMGAMLHDFYLYDWHECDDGRHRLHGFKHASTANENARKYFAVDDKTSHVILSHMWPLNIKKLPCSKEAWIVWAVDKIVSIDETLFRRKSQECA